MVLHHTSFVDVTQEKRLTCKNRLLYQHDPEAVTIEWEYPQHPVLWLPVRHEAARTYIKFLFRSSDRLRRQTGDNSQCAAEPENQRASGHWPKYQELNVNASGSISRSLSRFLPIEAARSITTLLMGEMLLHRRLGTVKVKYFTQEHNTMDQ